MVSENQFWADAVDQLDLALDQLFVGERNFDRFSMLLVDNVVELALHRFAREKASENRLWSALGSPKVDPRDLVKALGQSFEQKVKFACKMGLLSQSASESILNLHTYRNTAYHRGARHDGILHSLGVLYLKTACDLLSGYEPRGWSWSSGDSFSHRARKYLGSGAMMRVQHGSFVHAYKRLREVASALPHDVIHDLHRDMQKTIDDSDGVIQFLADKSPSKMTRDQAVVECQARPFATTEEAKKFAASKGYAVTHVYTFAQWLAGAYPWSICRDPIPGWRSRLEALQQSKDEHDALKRYCDFLRQTEDFRSELQEAGAQLYGYIQHQIDVARGK